MGHSRPLFHLLSSFRTQITKFTANKCEKMSIQYTVPGFELTTFGIWVSSHNHYTRATTFSTYDLRSRWFIRLVRFRFRKTVRLNSMISNLFWQNYFDFILKLYEHSLCNLQLKQVTFFLPKCIVIIVKSFCDKPANLALGRDRSMS